MTLDLRDPEVLDRLTTRGHRLEPDESVKFVLHENGSTGYLWHYDSEATGGLFTVHSVPVAGQRTTSRGRPLVGVPGERHYTITAGDSEGTGTLFAC